MAINDRGAACALSALLICSLAAPARSASFGYDEEFKRIGAEKSITTFGPDLLGDRVNLYDGTLSFLHTDVALPGNDALQVHVARTRGTGEGLLSGWHFGDWVLDIPRVHGVFAVGGMGAWGWTVPTGAIPKNNRCTGFQAPPAARYQSGVLYDAKDYWGGTFLYVPGHGEQEIVKRSQWNTAQPVDGKAYPLVTAAGWQITCLNVLPNGAGDETFEAVSPEGVRYTFNHWMTMPGTDLGDGNATSEERAGMQRLAGGAQPDLAPASLLHRSDIWLAPSKVTDRFGNWVQFNYNPVNGQQLLSMVSKDGRSISFEYDPADRTRIKRVIAAGRAWEYAYDHLGRLTSVRLPDGSSWVIDIGNLSARLDYGVMPTCEFAGAITPYDQTGTITHPSGATGVFTVRGVAHTRSKVWRWCLGKWDNGMSKGALYPRYFGAPSLKTKTLTGPGLTGLQWNYSYATGTASWQDCTSNCGGTKSVTVAGPEGRNTRHTFGTVWQANDGKVLKVEEGLDLATNTALRTTDYTYSQWSDAGGQPYPQKVGYSIGPGSEHFKAENLTPQRSRKITQQGVAFNWQVNAFDSFARPLSITRSSTPGPNRTDTTIYADDFGKWLLGQVKSVIESTTGLTVESHDYDAAGNQIKSHSFGRLLETRGFNPDGTVSARYDALNRGTFFANYKAGVARTVSYPDGAVERAELDDRGLITSLTNGVGSTTSYGYDSMGRLASITPPGGDPVAYHPTLLAFEQVPALEAGLEPGHWRQTVSTGNARSVRYFDALWRPLLSVTWDTQDAANTSRAVQSRFDADGRKTFESYPLRSIAAVSSAVLGNATVYDSLGRVSKHFQDSELGVLTTRTDYLTGFRRSTTNPRGLVTTASFQTFDTPSEGAISTLSAPQAVSVVIARDIFGKPRSITRSGTGGAAPSATRSYVYDAHQRLCKTVEPETGATIQAWDRDVVKWRASGLGLTNPNTCDDTSVPAASMVSYGYDGRDRLKTTTYGDGSPGIVRSYELDGRPLQVSSGGSTWTYVHNHRRLLTSESLNFAGSNYTTQWGIDAYGKVDSLSYPGNYPGGGTVLYSPNALGEPRQVSGFASGITYHPNGAVAGYTLANGIVHSLTLNTRGLPRLNRDAGVLQDGYTYDANGNITAIADQQEGLSSRAMAYDGLDRLTAANGIWGAGAYTYDALDNLRTSVVGSRALTHNYDAANRLTSLMGSQSIGFSYDANGNVRQRGAQGFVFDIGNRLTRATAKADYSYDGHGRRVWVRYADNSTRLQFYSQAGQLLYGHHSGQGITKYVYLGDKLIAEVTASGTTYTHTDALGSPVARTSGSASPTILSRTRYEPYGATAAGTNPNGIGFTGHVNDVDTGLVYMQQRYYEPLAGRFLSVDPVLTDSKSGQHFNRYAYVRNNPYRYTDPSGELPEVVERLNEMVTGPYGKLAEEAFSRGDYGTSAAYTVAGGLFGVGNALTLGQGAVALKLGTATVSRFGEVAISGATGAQRGVNTWWVGKEGQAAAEGFGGKTLGVSVEANKAAMNGDLGLVIQESIAAAKAASGPQNVFIGNGVGNIFWKKELPELLKNMDSGAVSRITIHF